jgi:creatinine amidohydrolase
MKLYDYNWIQLEDYLRDDDRVIVPLGSVEQHAQLSLGTDAILAERCAEEAADGTAVPVLPVLPFGLTPRFTAYPGTISLRPTVYMDIVHDILDGLAAHGFRRILLLSGHVGNAPAQDAARDWQRSHAATQILFHACIAEPSVWALARHIEADTGHASWVENFPWTRVAGADTPDGRKSMVDPGAMRVSGPSQMRELLGDGSFGGPYAMGDDTMSELWAAAVADVRAALTNGWAKGADAERA